MDELKNTRTHRLLKAVAWVVLIAGGAFVVLVVFRVVHFFNMDKTNAEVEKIHNTRLTMDDVMGVNLPPDPGEEADKTVAGVDANENGIRDDVELAIFREYPDSAKTRAVLLQYALVLGAIKPDLNEVIATTIAERESQAYDCIGRIVPRSSNDLEEIQNHLSFVERRQFNTRKREILKQEFNNKVRSFELKSDCDINLDLLTN